MKYLTVLFLLLFNWIQGQDPYTIKHSIEEGLPTSNVYSAMEDSNGYIWFGTDVGVLRFDGYEFEHYSTDDGLSDNEVFKTFEDNQNRIWFITLNGIPSYYKDGQFQNTKNNSLLKEAAHSKMMVEVYEHNGNLCVLHRDGNISKIDFKDKKVTRSKTEAAIYGYWDINSNIHYLNIDSVIDASNNTEYAFDESMYSSGNYRLITHQGRYLFSIKNKIYEFKDGKSKKVNSYEKAAEFIHLSSIDDELWIGTRDGLIISSGNNYQHYFNNLVVSYVLKDSEGNYWITTLNDGIKFIPNFNIKTNALLEGTLKVNALQKDTDHKLWIGTENGIYTLNNQDLNSTPKFINGLDDYIKKIRHYLGKTIAIGNSSITMFESEKISTFDFGANDFYYNGEKYYFSSSVVFAYDVSQLYMFPLIRNTNAKTSKLLSNNTIVRKRTNVIVPVENNNILFGTSTGLFRYERDSLYHVKPLVESLNTSIQDILYDSDNKRKIIATNSKGVTIFSNDKLHQLTKKQCLSSNTCYAIEPWKKSYLVATNKGVDRILIQDGAYKIKNLNPFLGIKNQKINDIEVVDSLIYLATDKGLLTFNSEALSKTFVKPRLVLEEIRINDSIQSNLSSLKHRQNNLSLSFTGISFSDYGNLNYEYRSNSGPWTPVENRNLEIKNLPPGQHDIELRTSGNSGLWSDSKHISLSIKPPFYKTIPFLLIVVLIIGLIIYLGVGKRIKSIEKAFNKERKIFNAKQEKMTLEKQIVELEQKALRMQMNPHFVFNALNTIKGYYSGGETKEANKYIGQFSKLLRLILENDKRLISLKKEIEIISLYVGLIQLRYVDVFSFKIIIDPEINTSEVGIPTLILQPLVENAIIHGLAPLNEKGELFIEFKKKGKLMICKVLDNGIGYSKSLSKKLNGKKLSKAIQITKERIAIENNHSITNDFVIRDRLRTNGTEVVIKLPLINFW